MIFEKGEVLVPRETPFGPAEARIAWADELGQLLVVVAVLDHGRVVRVNAPAQGETVERMSADIAREYERPDTSEESPSWGAFLMRAATEAARVQRSEFTDDAGYWMAVARAVTRVEVEVFDHRREAVAQLSDAGTV